MRAVRARRRQNDNCGSFEGPKLQIPADQVRHHYVKTRMQGHRYVDGTLALFHGPRRLNACDHDRVSMTQATSSSRWKLAAGSSATRPPFGANRLHAPVFALRPSPPHPKRQKRTIHVLLNRTSSFTPNMRSRAVLRCAMLLLLRFAADEPLATGSLG